MDWIHLAEPCVKLRQLFEVVVSQVERGEGRQTSQLLHLESGGASSANGQVALGEIG